MAERKFDYTNVASVYQNMQTDSQEIADILKNINKDVHEYVDVCDMALYGDLGKQLLLDWDNTSSNFDNFVTNFNNWSTVVAQVAGKYSDFENSVKELKGARPLGVTSGQNADGTYITQAYTETGVYSTYDQDLINTNAAYIGPFYAFNGTMYEDTNRVILEEQRKTNAKWAFAVNSVSTVLSIWGGSSAVKASNAAFSAAKGTEVLQIGSGQKPLALTDGSSTGNVITSTGGTVNNVSNVAKTASAWADDGTIAAGKYAGKTWDDLIAMRRNMTSEEMRTFTRELKADGVVNNYDDVARLFEGASNAKTHFTSSEYNKLFKNVSTNPADVTGATNATNPTNDFMSRIDMDDVIDVDYTDVTTAAKNTGANVGTDPTNFTVNINGQTYQGPGGSTPLKPDAVINPDGTYAAVYSDGKYSHWRTVVSNASVKANAANNAANTPVVAPNGKIITDGALMTTAGLATNVIGNNAVSEERLANSTYTYSPYVNN